MNAKDYIAKLSLDYSDKEKQQQILINKYRRDRRIAETQEGKEDAYIELKAAQARLQAYTQARLDIESILDEME